MCNIFRRWYWNKSLAVTLLLHGQNRVDLGSSNGIWYDQVAMGL